VTLVLRLIFRFLRKGTITDISTTPARARHEEKRKEEKRKKETLCKKIFFEFRFHYPRSLLALLPLLPHTIPMRHQ
jgi:nickel-dependent lactate racemase